MMYHSVHRPLSGRRPWLIGDKQARIRTGDKPDQVRQCLHCSKEICTGNCPEIRRKGGVRG